MLDDGEVKNESACRAFGAFLNLPERETRPSVLGTTVQHLRLFDSQLIRRLTDRTTIDIDAFIEGVPMTIYIVVPPVLIRPYAAILRMWFSGLIYALTRRERPLEHRTLLMCDEIASMGRMDAFVTAATLLRGWGVSLWSFWQNPACLEAYGADARTLVDNAGVLQFLGASNIRMAREVANLVGGIDAEETMAMPQNEQLLLIDGIGPTRCRRMRYFEEEMFEGRFDANPMIARGARG